MFLLDEGGRVVVRDIAAGSPADNAGISPGSIITRVDSVDLTAENYTDIFARLRSPELLRATFDVYLNGETRRIPLTKAHFDDPTVRAVSVSEIVQGAPDHIGYIHIQRFARNTAPQVYAAIEGFLESGVTHVILDLRYNPGGDRDSVNDVARMLVPQGIIYSTIDSRGSSRPVHSRLTATYFEHVAVLTNSRTASAAELLALAVSESGAGTIVGQRTFGKGSIQTIFPLTRGDYFIFTTMEYFGRNGTRINNIGVSPDIAAAIPDYLHGEALPDYDGTSDRIPYVKQLLDFLGYPVGTPDTYHDTTTRASIEQIQSYHGITPSGLVDTTTAFLLDSLLRRELARNDIALRQALDILT
ncbi:MAG: S41 family peptidase, partial [Defluviitaleaceae bacterium]|nr:S41 family peptidase [Defluviitaleaceae bacterium]